MNGTFTAIARDYALGMTNGGDPQVAVLFEITEGEETGKVLTWHGFFTEKTTARTIESLRHCGWQGNDLDKISPDDLTAAVSIVVEEESYKGKVYDKIQYVNRLGAGLAVKTRMDPSAAASFAARMKGACMAVKPSTPAAPKPRPVAPARAPQRDTREDYPENDTAEPDPF